MRSFSTRGAPHLPAPTSVQRVMLDVLLALLPGIAAHVCFFGPGVLLQLVLAVSFALLCEAAMLKARGASVSLFLSDLSAVVTAVLFILCIPPLAPWWITLLGMLAAIVVAKQWFGGIGYNLFNPAMVGYAIVLLCFPREMSQWLSPLTAEAISLGAALDAIFRGILPQSWDTISSATPLDSVRALSLKGLTLTEIHRSSLFGDFGGKGWEWIANAYALGGLYLLRRRVIRWQVPLGVLGSVIVLSLPFWLSDTDSHSSPLAHIFSGGLMLAAFFIATDPVTGCSTPLGRLLFGAGVGAITLLIRRWGDYPDGVAFAVLLMNCCAPLLDRYTAPRIFGWSRRP
jgi:electron transport complex protein RnfD